MSQIPNEEELLRLLDAVRKLERDFKLGHRFNLFEALNISRQEIRHSRFLAYLLDPHAAHGLGERFLRGILLAAADGHPELPVSRLELSIKDLSDASVQCERDHFDITVQVPSLKLLFVIENKVDAAEGDGQLKRYRELASKKYPDYKFMGSFLTPDGYEGEDSAWGTMSYGQVVNEIRSVLTDTALSPEVHIALNHYVDLIEREIMTSKTLIDACREIYRNHKNAFDLVIEHGQESLFGRAFDEFLSNQNNSENVLIPVARRTASAYFLPESWVNIANACIADRTGWQHEFPVLFWFELRGNSLKLRLEIGPINNQEVRMALVDRFVGQYRNNRANRYTRVGHVQANLGEDPTVEDVLMSMNNLWDQWGPVQTEDVANKVTEWVAQNPVAGN